MANFSSKNEGSWFYFDGDKALGGVSLRELSAEKNKEIERLTVKTTKKFKRGQWIEDKKVNTELANKLTWDYCIVDWDKVQLDGNDIKCDREGKSKMMKVLDFMKFVLESGDQLTEANKTIEEARVKNLDDTSHGSLPKSTAKTAK